jgi:hypothetical protein
MEMLKVQYRIQFNQFLRCGVCLLVGAVPLFLCGCSEDGPELGEVRGTVTMGGTPVPFVYVQFQPIDPPGTYGAAYTKVDGTYELQFSQSRFGAPVGKHQVTLKTSSLEDLEVEDKSTGLMKKPDLPEGFKPNVEQEFEREVKTGTNVHDFELTAK